MTRSEQPWPEEPAVELFAPAKDRFDEWMRAEVPGRSADPRYEVRRATPADFEAVYDLVDQAFGVVRPRAQYDWLYRDNPWGLARAWIVVEKKTGRFVGAGTGWPWPAARGDVPLHGTMKGDAAVLPHLQRQGVSGIRRLVTMTHPFHLTGLTFSWANAKTRGSIRKHQRIDTSVTASIPRWRLDLSARAHLTRRGWPRWLAAAGGAVLDRLGHAGTRAANGLRLEIVSRFDARFDPVTAHCMRFDEYWSPHDSRFLNWRYPGHPVHEYRSLALHRGEEVLAYAVVKLDGPRAELMEFAAPREDAPVCRTLLIGAVELARAAHCRRLEFSSTSSWRHLETFLAAGFAERPTAYAIMVWDRRARPTVPEDWQLVPGDNEAL